MKNTYETIVSVILLALFTGCSTTKSNEVNSAVVVENRWDHGVVMEYYLNPKYENDSTRAIIHYTIAKSINPLKSLTDSLMSNYLDHLKTPIDSLSLKMYCKSFVEEYVDLVTNDSIDNFPWYLNISLDFSSVDDRNLQASFFTEGYMGGAHGNSNFTYYMIDSQQNKVLKLEDICSDIPALEKRAEVYFRKMNEIKEGESLSESGFWFQDNKFHLNQNFYFNSETLTFVYNQYEIASYAMGISYLELPLNEMKDLLKIKRSN